MLNRLNQFHIGDIVHHRRYNYRGVVFAYDSSFRGSDEWYQSNRTQPDRQQPWYHVLVNDAGHTTYVAEENLLPAESPDPINHPLVERLFGAYHEGRYYVHSLN
ncbi:MAG: heat shock protein HspQ [Leptospiraceae bacterium]|nr:heat shock protein HspQ [Leptospiraceae bacterium]MCB1315441.1 heat shock protein HspQ [Leptospiraceae bacterium]